MEAKMQRSTRANESQKGNKKQEQDVLIFENDERMEELIS